MAYPELRLLGRWKHTGTLDANTSWSPSPTSTTTPNLPQGQLNGKQVGEVAYAVIYSPVTALGATESLDRVQLVLDGVDYPYVWWSGRQDINMAPPPSNIRRGRILTLGQSFLGRNGEVSGLLEATCPKFVTSVAPKAWAGDSAVDDDFTVEFWGYVYNSVDLAKRVPAYDMANRAIPDPLNNREFTVVGRRVEAGGDWRSAWAALQGGAEQGSATAAPIFPIVRRARNKNATTVSEAYIPEYQNGTDAVDYATDSMYFTLNARQAIFLQRFGVNGPDAPNSTGYDLKSAWVQTPGEAQQVHPYGGVPANYNRNEISFGQVAGQLNKFDTLPELRQGPQLLWNETAYPTFVDNGTSIPADDVKFAIAGVQIGPVSG